MPSIEDNYSIDDLAHCAFAASIRADPRNDFVRVDFEIAVQERDDSAVMFDNVMGRKRLSHVLLLEVRTDNFLVRQDGVKQVGIGLAFAHRQTFIEVLRGDDGSHRQNK